MRGQPEIAACSARANICIIKRLFLPRKPGVCAYAADALVEIYSLLTPQRKTTAPSL